MSAQSVLVRRVTPGAVLFLLMATVAGCSGGGGDYQSGPPAGWMADGAKWWLDGVDTSGVYPDLETLQSMGASGTEVTYALSSTAARGVYWEHLNRAVKQSMIEMFRNEPTIVDSLFDAYVTPRIRDGNHVGDPDEDVKRLQKEAVRLVRLHFRQAHPLTRIGEDVPFAIPDSLKETVSGERVRTQIRVDRDGQPVAIWRLSGAHPVLDDLVMQAIAQLEWQPAYLLQGGSSDPVPSWVRYNLRMP